MAASRLMRLVIGPPGVGLLGLTDPAPVLLAPPPQQRGKTLGSVDIRIPRPRTRRANRRFRGPGRRSAAQPGARTTDR
eukprot:14787928-Alexandrium_andersonii.AAC.1